MIISKKHRFCFIKTHKTAGTSLEIALSRYCGDEDVITPMGGTDESLRRRISGRGAQNYRRSVGDLGCLGLLRALRHRHLPALWNHAPFTEAVEFCSFEGFPHDYFIFAVERHPYDKVKSRYFHRKRHEFSGSFDNFCKEDLLKKASDWSLYTKGGQIIAKVYQYAKLREALVDIQEKTGLPKLTLAKAKTGFHTAEEIDFSRRGKLLVQKVFAKEFDAFGYDR